MLPECDFPVASHDKQGVLRYNFTTPYPSVSLTFWSRVPFLSQKIVMYPQSILCFFYCLFCLLLIQYFPLVAKIIFIQFHFLFIHCHTHHIVKIERYYKKKIMVLDEILDLKNRFKMTNFAMLDKKSGEGANNMSVSPCKSIWKKIPSLWLKRLTTDIFWPLLPN